MEASQPRRPATRRDFEIAIICALTLEADAIDALFDHHWDDDGPPYNKTPSDPNAYSTGNIGRHNVVLAHMPGMGKANAAAVAAHCRASFPNVKIALVVGICGVVPFGPDGEEIVLGDVIVSDGVIQYDLGRQLPDRFARKDTLLDSLGRPNAEIRGLLAKLKGLRSRKALRGKMTDYLDVLRTEPELAAEYPGSTNDRLFAAAYRHASDKGSCEELRCNGNLIQRKRLKEGNPQPVVHFGLIASSDTVMKCGEERDSIARKEKIIAFEMESAGVWDSFPCVVIKGACDYADSHKTKAWQRYASATAAACTKAFLDNWVPSSVEPNLVKEQPAGPWFLVPYPKNETFIGRQSILEKLQQQPLESGSQSRIALFGLGGIGKTQIALAYAYWFRETRPEVSVFWVHASTAERFREAFAWIALECRIPGYDDPKADFLSLVKTWLEKKDRGRWLMIIDNADDTQVFFVRPLGLANVSTSSCESDLGHYIPECAHGSILVTTRNKQAGLRLTKSKPLVEVGKMDECESNQLLHAKLEDGLRVDDLSTLSSRLEYLPLALVQAAAFIQENTMKVGKYLQLLDQSDQDLVELLSKEFETVGRDSKIPHAVATTWIISFEQIAQHNTFASELLSVMSFFDRQSIPEKFLHHYDGRQQDQDESKHEKIEAKSDIDFVEALGILKAFSFISTGKDESLNIHRLVQLVTQKWLAKKGTVDQFAGQALQAVSNLYPWGKYENRVICNKYLPHVYAVLKHKGTSLPEEAVAKAFLLHNTAGFFQYQGLWKEAEELEVQAIEISKKVLGAEHPDTLASIASLAAIYMNERRWKEAEELQVQVLEMSKRVLGAEHPNTLASIANLASTYRNQRRWKEAKELVVQVIETRKRVLGAEHPDTLTSMANLASTYMNQGRWKEAEELDVRVMETNKRVLGAEHPDTLASIANLASTYMNQGRWKEAEELQVQVIEMSKRVLGAEHPNTLISKANLASTYRNQRRWKEAKELVVQVMEINKRVLGAEHPNTLSSMANLALTYTTQRQWKEAKQLFVQVIEISKRVLGAEHLDTLTYIANLALMYTTQGRWKEAEELLVQVMETRKRVLGAEHPNTLTSMADLAVTLKRRHRDGEAVALLKDCVRAQLRVLGTKHPEVLIGLRALREWSGSKKS